MKQDGLKPREMDFNIDNKIRYRDIKMPQKFVS